MGYSRKQLEALGEPFGECATRKKLGGGYIAGGGGSSTPQSQPSSSTSYNTNIPEYAKPYVTNMLEATQKNLFNMDDTGAISGFKPYKPYSTDVNNYVAGFSPMQQQAFGNLAGMQPNAGVGNAMNQTQDMYNQSANAAPYDAQNFSNQYGQGPQFQNRGLSYLNTNSQNFGQQSAQDYMSPYQQNVTDVQKNEAIRDYGRNLPGQNAQAVGSGAFGGSRQAIVAAEGQRNLQNQLGGIQAAGSQNAYQNAQQQFNADQARRMQSQLANQGAYGQTQGLGMQQNLAGNQQAMQNAQLQAQYGLAGQQATEQSRQYGANYGLQNRQQGLSAAQQLGALGQTQYGQQMGINQAQQQAGGQQQAAEQSKINQAIQNYATEQQYPMMQLGMMSNMLRGLPLQSTTTQSYQATPSALTQGIAGLGTLGSAYNAFNPTPKAEGGAIKGLAGGGEVASYSVGGAIRQQLDSMTTDQLKQVAQTSQSSEIRSYATQLIATRTQVKGQDPDAARGLTALDSGSTLEAGLAAGGIIAFANEGVVPDPDSMQPGDPVPSIQELIRRQQSVRQQVGIVGEPGTERLAELEKRKAELPEQENRDKYLEAMRFFAQMGTTPGSVATAALTAAGASAPRFQELARTQAEVRNKLSENEEAIRQLGRAEKLGLAKDATGQQSELRKENVELEKVDREIAGRFAGIQETGKNLLAVQGAKSSAQKQEETILRDYMAQIAAKTGKNVNDPGVRAQAYAEMQMDKGGRGAGIEATADVNRAREAAKSIKELRTQLMGAEDKEKPAIQAQIDQLTRIVNSVLTGGDSSAVARPQAPAGTIRFDASGNQIK